MYEQRNSFKIKFLDVLFLDFFLKLFDGVNFSFLFMTKLHGRCKDGLPSHRHAVRIL